MPDTSGTMRRDQLNRRLRTAGPQPRVRRLVITEADLALFRALARHGPLPTHYLFEFTRHLRRDYSHLQHRLTEFFNGDAGAPYLVRPRQQFANYRARYQHAIYDLAPRARLLIEQGCAQRFPYPRPSPFVHQLMQACVGASLELTARTLGLRYISRAEILCRDSCPRATRESDTPLTISIPGTNRSLIPDDLCGLEYPGVGYRFFAIEIDRATESLERTRSAQSSFAQKVEGYLSILRGREHQRRWGIPKLTVLTVTTSPQRAATIIQNIGRRHGVEVNRFAVSYIPGFEANWALPPQLLHTLLSAPWLTIEGHRHFGWV